MTLALAGCLAGSGPPDPGPPRTVWADYGDHREPLLDGPRLVLDRDGQWREAYRYVQGGPLNVTLYFDGGFRLGVETTDCDGLGCDGIDARWYEQGGFTPHPIGLPSRVARGLTTPAGDYGGQSTKAVYLGGNEYAIKSANGPAKTHTFDDSNWVMSTYAQHYEYERVDGDVMPEIPAWPLAAREYSPPIRPSSSLPGVQDRLFPGGLALQDFLAALRDEVPAAGGACVTRMSLGDVSTDAGDASLILPPDLPVHRQTMRIEVNSSSVNGAYRVQGTWVDGEEPAFEVDRSGDGWHVPCSLDDLESVPFTPEEALDKWASVFGLARNRLAVFSLCVQCSHASQLPAIAGHGLVVYSFSFFPDAVEGFQVVEPPSLSIDAHMNRLDRVQGMPPALIVRST